MAEQLPLIRVPKRPKGRWELRAERLLADLRKRGALGPDAAGYADSLRQAGADRDHAEADESHWARFEARRGWDQALSRLVPAPTDATREGDDDPYADLIAQATRRPTVRDAP